MGKNYINPLCAVAGWGEVYMNASMESIINGYEDPRGRNGITPPFSKVIKNSC